MMPTLETLGDIAAGAGVALSDMAQIYGKSMSKGKVQTEELNQMAGAGHPDYRHARCPVQGIRPRGLEARHLQDGREGPADLRDA